MTPPDPRSSSVRRNIGTWRGKGTGSKITILHAVVTVRSTSTVLTMIVLLVRGEAVALLMTTVCHVLLALVSVIAIRDHLLIGLPQGVMTCRNLTRVTVVIAGLRQPSLRNDCYHIRKSQLRNQFVELNGWMIL